LALLGMAGIAFLFTGRANALDPGGKSQAAMDMEYEIVAEIADKACRTIAISVRRYLQGEDSSLATDLGNIWNDVCVQVQGLESLFWGAYLESLRLLICERVAKLEEHIKLAIWLTVENSGENGNRQVNEDEITDYILNDYVLAMAVNWENKRIRDYLF
jgi:hypothetical protein